ncbi:MAG TPA: RNA polymerase sigma factor [Gemmatimonadaceae bacterium]|nr:RNA polymerase sigma factor [Gemmatimonadaceae bacterium]
MAQSPHTSVPEALLDDAELARRIAQSDPVAFETLMQRHNAKLFRIARSILKDDAEAEDALQDAYLAAFRRMASFRGGSQLVTWLTRIVINQSLMRLRKQRRHRVVVPFDGPDRADRADAEVPDRITESPVGATLRAEIRRMLERRIDELPTVFRTVFVMREVNDMTVEETAACLSIPAATVRSRLFRARALLRESLARDVDVATGDVFAFAGDRCDRIVAAVLAAF